MLDPDITLALINGLGLMALMAIAFGSIERLNWPRPSRSLSQGLVFGLGAVLAMMSPAEVAPGLIVDARSIIVAFAAAFGGWPAALLATAMAVAYRLWLGGAGAMLGAAGILVAAGLGLSWRYWLRPRVELREHHLVVLGLWISCYMLTGFFMQMPGWQSIVLAVAPYMIPASVAGSVVFGLLVDRELSHIAREQHWKTRALTDPLTALPNRRAFQRDMVKARTGTQEAALLLIDIDHFKRVNDTYGHAAGDYVLQHTALALRTNMRQRDLIARMGGEELVALLPDTGAARARQIAGRLRRSIEAMSVEWEGQTISITVSIGVAIAPGDLPEDQFLVRADGALYAAKRAGRNQVMFADDVSLRPSMVLASQHLPIAANGRPKALPRVA